MLFDYKRLATGMQQPMYVFVTFLPQALDRRVYSESRDLLMTIKLQGSPPTKPKSCKLSRVSLKFSRELVSVQIRTGSCIWLRHRTRQRRLRLPTSAIVSQTRLLAAERVWHARLPQHKLLRRRAAKSVLALRSSPQRVTFRHT